MIDKFRGKHSSWSTKRRFQSLSCLHLSLFLDLFWPVLVTLKIMSLMKTKPCSTWARQKPIWTKLPLSERSFEKRWTKKMVSQFSRFMILQNNLHERRREDLLWLKKLRCPSATWVTDAGPSITSPPRFKLDSTDPQRLSLAYHTAQLLTYGASLVWSLRWSLETSYLSLDQGQGIAKMTITLPRWLSSSVRFLSTLHLVGSSLKSSLITRDS